MQRPRPETVTLDDVVITEELSRRSPRSPNWQAEAQAMQSLARQMASHSETLLQSLVDMALNLCNAGSAGVSELSTTANGEEVFRWTVLAGKKARSVGEIARRDFSPCGVCLDRGTPQLFSYPDRYFTYLQEANTPIVEALVLPLIADRHSLGTIWIMSHDEQRHFDSEDVRIMTSLADFAAAVLFAQRQTQELLAVNTAKTAEIVERQLSEERARALLSNLPNGAAFVVDRNLRYLLAEGEALYAADFNPEDLVGKTIFEAMPPELTAHYEKLYRQALAGEPFEYEHNAHDRWYISRGTPLRSANGDVYAVLAVSYDITDRKQVEADAAADLDNTQRLRELGVRLVAEDNIQTLYQEIMATAIALTRADAGTVQILDKATQDLLLLATQGFEPNVTEHFYRVNVSSNTPCGIALRNGDRTFVDFDVPQSEDLDGSMRIHVEAGYLSAQSTPLITRTGKAIGMVSTHWSRHHRPTERELRFLDLLARQAADLIEQRQAEAALRESEERFRLLAIASSDIVYRMSADWSEMRTLEGKNILVSTENPSQTWIETYLPPEEQSMVWAAIQAAIQTKSKFELEHRVIQQDGTIGWTFSRAIPMLNEQGEIIEWFGAASDVTDRKRAEAQLHQAAEMDAFRVKLSDALRSLTDPVGIQTQACRLLGEHLGVDRAYYVEVNEAKKYARINQNYLRGDSPTLVGVFRLADYGWTVPLLQRGKTIIVADAENSDIIPAADREAMAAVRIASHISTPLVKAGALVGALCVTESQPRQWSQTEIELVRETAERIWAAIERARAEAALRESEIQRIQEQSARQEERQRAEALAALDRAKTLFFSNVSHEFRTPLTLLLAPLQDALSDRAHPLALPQRERLELVQRNATRLLKLVNTLLDFSRIEAGRMEAVYEPTDLAIFTTELASVFRSAIERAGLRLVVDCPPLSEPVYVDREMWEKIVLNLLSNASKFTLKGEIAVRLHPTDGNCVMLQIQDTGTGIAPEELPHLFERFYQVRGTQARTHEGSEIGLALVQELIRMHGGTVEVSSTVEQGTCFTVTMPLGTAHLPSDRLRRVVGDRNTTTRSLASTALGSATYVEEARWLSEAGSSENSKFKLQNSKFSATNYQLPITNYPHTTRHSARVLLVDDNADMRDYLTRILSEYVQVEAVADGAAALAAARARVPDLVLSDIMMPQLDGFGLLKALRADPQTREIPIVLLSARAGEEAIVEGLEAGADDYLIKPFSATELVSRVNAHLQMAQLRSQALHQERTTSRRKDELLSTVSHELNTPLVAILGWTRLLRANPLSQSILMKSLETIERNATLQAKLIQDLLDISRIEAGKLRLSQEPVELKSVIEMAIATVSQMAEAKHIHLVWWTTGRASDATPEQNDDSVIVMGDRDRLTQIVCNLLTNAIKFTPAGGRVEISLARAGSREQGAGSRGAEEQRSGGAEEQRSRGAGELRSNYQLPITNYQLPTTNYQLPTTTAAQIQIKDTGIGISAEFLPHVFDRFRQAKESDAAKGLGLGLAIARHLVELHNGTIHAESSGVGLGATFTVKLPILQQ